MHLEHMCAQMGMPIGLQANVKTNIMYVHVYTHMFPWLCAHEIYMYVIRSLSNVRS